MTHNQLNEIFANSDYTVRDYSGRGSYGRVCCAVVGSSAFEIIADMIEGAAYAKTGLDELPYLIRESKQDSMGYDTVLYWPSVAFDFALASEEEDCDCN